ncbi:phage tail sheath subtilisin-like domain-containing protein [Chitinophaga sp. sic0106]|nr:phage tail sheath subtilisin-like domain-containing protein [Chitinophaga sp. sic0106]
MAVAQAGLLQDRVVLLDLREYDEFKDTFVKESAVADVHTEFRDNIGINDLKYAAAYTPWLISTYAPEIPYTVLKANVKNKAGGPLNLTQVTTNAALNALVQKTETAVSDLANVKSVVATGKEPAATAADRFNDLKSLLSAAATDTAAKTAFLNLLTYVRGLVNAIPTWKGATPLVNTQLLSDLESSAKDANAGLAATIKALISFEKNADVVAFEPAPAVATAYAAYDAATVNSWWKVFPKEDFDGEVIDTVDSFKATTTDYGAAADKAAAIKAAADLEVIFRSLLVFLNRIQTSAAKYVSSNQSALYATHPVIAAAVTALQTKLAIVPPAGAVAGVYAKTDRERGVWKAPANTSLNSVSAPLAKIDNNTQDGLNVDADAGKSINAIRAFSGKGTLVWGARTLDGNSNEWRYISVRRLFNMVEESVKKSTAPFVFEPNDANTWVKVKGMVENYLTTLWRQGALAGAKTDQAFFVRVGLGQTMTEQDILEGRLLVEIGMAAVRPAEFIILRFSHKMQES